MVLYAPTPVYMSALRNGTQSIMATGAEWLTPVKALQSTDDPHLTPYRSVSQNSDESLRLKKRDDDCFEEFYSPLVAPPSTPTLRFDSVCAQHTEIILENGPLIPTPSFIVRQPFCFFPSIASSLHDGSIDVIDVMQYLKTIPNFQMAIRVLLYYHGEQKLDAYQKMFNFLRDEQTNLATMSDDEYFGHLLKNDCYFPIAAVSCIYNVV